MRLLPLAGPAACPGSLIRSRRWRLSGDVGPCGDRVWAGQTAWAGGVPVAASNRFIHSAWRCQPPSPLGLYQFNLVSMAGRLLQGNQPGSVVVRVPIS